MVSLLVTFSSIFCNCLLLYWGTDWQKIFLSRRPRLFYLWLFFLCFGDWSLLIDKFLQWKASFFWFSKRLPRLSYRIQLDFTCDYSSCEKLRTFVKFSRFIVSWMAAFRRLTPCKFFPAWGPAWGFEHEFLKWDLLGLPLIKCGILTCLVNSFWKLNMLYFYTNVLLKAVLNLQSVSLTFSYKRWFFFELFYKCSRGIIYQDFLSEIRFSVWMLSVVFRKKYLTFLLFFWW